MNNKKTFYTNPISLTFDQVDYDYIINCIYILQSYIEKELQELEADSSQIIHWSDKDLFVRSKQEPYKPVVGKIKGDA